MLFSLQGIRLHHCTWRIKHPRDIMYTLRQHNLSKHSETKHAYLRHQLLLRHQNSRQAFTDQILRQTTLTRRKQVGPVIIMQHHRRGDDRSFGGVPSPCRSCRSQRKKSTLSYTRQCKCINLCNKHQMSNHFHTHLLTPLRPVAVLFEFVKQGTFFLSQSS